MDSINQATTASKNGKLAKTAGYYLAFIALGLSTASLGPTLLGLARHTQSQLSQVSFLFTANALGYLGGSLLGGRLYDRMPGHRVQALSLLLMAGLMALAPTLPLLWLLAAVLVLLGFVQSTLDVGGNTLLVWVHREQVPPFMNGLHFFFGIGAFLSPVIIAQAVLLSGDITWGYWILALLLLPVAGYLVRLPSPPIQGGARAGASGRVDNLLVGLIMLFFFLNVGAEGSFGGWIFSYARALNLADEATAAYLTSAFWGGLTAGRLLAIPLSARFRPRAILLADVLGTLLGLALVLLGRGSFVLVLAGAICTGLSMASIFPTTITFAERFLPINGRITGLFFVGASLGSMLIPWLIGQLFEPVGPQVTMVILLLVMAAALAVFGGLVARGKRLNR